MLTKWFGAKRGDDYQAREEVVHEDLVGEEPLESFPELGGRLLEDVCRIFGVTQLLHLLQLVGVGILFRQTLRKEGERKREDLVFNVLKLFWSVIYGFS